MNIEIKKSIKPVNYFDAINILESRLKDLYENNEQELIWTLEHNEVFTAGTSYKQNEIIDKNSDASLLELKPITGRKHQLRKQLYAIGNPIFGDTKYKLSNSNKGINKNLMLHSYQIKFKINDIKHTYSALLPDYFKKLLKSKRLRFSNLK